MTPLTSTAALLPGLASLEPVDLPAVLEAAALQQRVDRKYLVPVAEAERLVEQLRGSHRVLEIAGRRCNRYRSTYLDTPDLRSCRDHLQGRRLRWKARSRLYVEDGLCRFEVKVRTGRGETLKHVLDVGTRAYGRSGPVEEAFLQEVLGRTPPVTPVLEVEYTRATLVDLDAGTRVTLDRGVTASGLGRPGPLPGGRVVLAEDLVVVETKGGTRLSTADRCLHALGHRPRSLSKYATSAALLADDVPDNDVRHLVGRRLRVEPATALADRRAS